MNEFLKRLKGKKVLQARRTGETLALEFSAERYLVVHNKWTICEAKNSSSDDISLLRGRVLTDVAEEPQGICFNLEGLLFQIDLGDEAWAGPEAVVLYERDVPVVVCN